MLWTRSGGALALGLVFCAACLDGAPAQEDFPFDRELLLDARPMKGSKRLPNLEVEANGAATIELWCNSVQARIVVNGEGVAISAGEKTDRQCTPERAQADDQLLEALTQVAGWRWDGENLVLTGAKELRFRLQTN
jgi:heat shock protein HslJ